LNLAASDVLRLGKAIAAFYGTGKTELLEGYSDGALRRVWRAQRFSWWMTQMLHRFPGESPFDYKRQLTDLDYVISSKAALTSLAENYVGLPMDIYI
jgi:p-hydroxybenzoate 3-monooxygenase